MPSLSERIWALAAAPKSTRPAGSDAELLAHLRSGAADALAHLVTRHGPAVWRVCRARLSNGADVDDAFQATFLALAQSPSAVRDPESLAAWLNGVAARVCLKLERHRRRHPADSLTSDPVGKLTDPATEAERRELSATVLDEVARLPDKLRTVILLCSLGGQTSAETAGQLGVPVGTVESRLSTARARLKLRLERRGIAAAGLAIVFAEATATTAECARLLILLAGPLGARPASQLVISLATGVTTTMTTLKLLTMTLLTGLALGGVGYGLASGTGEGPQEGEAAVKKQVEGAKRPEVVAKTADPVATDAKSVREQTAADEAQMRRKLQTPATKVLEPTAGLTIDSVFAVLHKQGIYIRFDYPAIYRQNFVQTERMGDAATTTLFGASEGKLGEVKLKLDPQPGETLGEYLSTLCVLIDARLTYRIRGNQVLITPAYMPVSIPGLAARNGVNEELDPRLFAETMSGPPVSVAFERESLAGALATLRQLTGANIAMSFKFSVRLPQPGQGEQAADRRPPDITATFDDVRLYTVLEIIGQEYDLEPVYLRNVFYLTTPERAKELRRKQQEELYGKPPPPYVAPLVTDGVPAPADPAKPQPSTSK